MHIRRSIPAGVAAAALVFATANGVDAKTLVKGNLNGAFKANTVKKIFYTAANGSLVLNGTQLKGRAVSKSITVTCFGVPALQVGVVTGCIATVFFINPLAQQSQAWTTIDGALSVEVTAVKGKTATVTFSGSAPGDEGNSNTPLTISGGIAKGKVTLP